jgi:hypothetical protein
VALLLAYLRDEGAYRVGQYDSLNRMFMQVVPLAVLYVVVVYATAGRTRPVAPSTGVGQENATVQDDQSPGGASDSSRSASALV